MFKVKVIAQGQCKESWLLEALAEYEKRLRGQLTIEWVIVLREEELIQKALAEKQIIALDLHGELLSSEVLSKKLFLSWGSRPVFVIGGPDHLPLKIAQHAQFRWSLSPLTFTHQMVRLLLVEQLYRALEISQGGKYHK